MYIGTPLSSIKKPLERCRCYLGEDSHFDEHIFQMGWFNHPPTVVFLFSGSASMNFAVFKMEVQLSNNLDPSHFATCPVEAWRREHNGGGGGGP